MPTDFTDPNFKQWFLSKNNLDPAKYDLDSQGKVFEKASTDPSGSDPNDFFSQAYNDTQPTAQPPPQPTLPTSTPQKYGVGASILDHTLASIFPTGTGLAGAAGLSWLAGPEAGLPVSILAGIVGGLGGGAIGAKAQSAVLPDNVKQQLSEEQEEHPYASLIGDVTPGLALSNPIKSISNLSKLGGRGFGLGINALSDAERESLITGAANIGTQGGLDVYNQLSSSQPFDYKRLGLSTLAGAAMNEPNEVLGSSKLNPANWFGTHAPSELPVNNNIPEAPPSDSLPSSSQWKPDITPSLSNDNIYDMFKPSSTTEPIKRETQPYEGGLKLPTSMPDNAQELIQPAPASPIRQEGGINPESGTVANNTLDTAAQKANLGLTKYQEESSQEQEPENDNLLVNATPAYKQQVTELAAKRGISLKEADEVLTNTGKSVLGKYEPANREATVSISKAELDTPQHEVAHGYIGDLLHSADPNDVALAQSGLNIFKGDPKGLEEALVSKLGVEATKRSANLEGGAASKFDQWFGDFVSRWKNNLGLANDADTIRLLTQRLHTDAPYGSKAKLLENVARDRMSYNALVQSFKQEPDLNKKFAIQAQIEALKNKYEGMPPKMQEESSKQTNTPEFKKWFGNSKVVDENGEPLTVYHGTQKAGFNSFWSESHFGTKEQADDILRAKDKYRKTKYIETGKNKELQDSISFGDKDAVYPIYLKIENPKRVSDQGNSIRWHTAIDKAKAEGFDGIVYTNIMEGPGKDSYVPFSPNQVKSAIGNKGTFDPSNPDIRYQSESALPRDQGNFPELGRKAINEKPEAHPLEHYTFPLTRTLADAALMKEGPRALPAINAAIHQRNLNEEYYNRYDIPMKEATKDLSTDQKDYLQRLMLAEQKYGISYKGALQNYPQLEKAYDGVRKVYRSMQEDRINANQPVKAYTEAGDSFKREAKIDPYFAPQRISPEIIELLKNGAPESEQLRADWNKHNAQFGIDEKQSNEMLDSLVNSYTKGASTMDHFRGVDIEQGHGLPYSFMRPGFDRNWEGYNRRYANARAFHDAIESNPNVAPLYGITKSPWGADYSSAIKPLQSPEFQHIAEHIAGSDYDSEEGMLHGLSKTAASSVLSIPTNLHIIGSTVAGAFNYAKPLESIPMLTHAFAHFSDSIEHAMSTGSYQNKPRIFRDLFNAHSTQVERVNSLADGIARIGGRQVTDYATKGIVQGMGEYLVKRRIPEAMNGDQKAIRFLKNIDPNYSLNKEYSEQDVWRLATNFTRLLHGTHDFRTLPGWMLKDNVVAPFVSLMSWNVTQTNSFMKNVVTEARKGNITPLVMSTLGATLGGYLIKEMREKVTNKQSPIPSFAEIAAGDNDKTKIPLYAYNWMAMASFAGYAGLLSTGAKALFDLSYKNPIQAPMFPLDEVMSEGGNTIREATAALINSQPDEYIKIGTKAIADLFKNNVQLARMGLSWADEAGLTGEQRQRQKVLSNEENQLRRFKTVEGLPVNDESSIDETNPYYNMERKSFLRENDLGKAAQQLPEQIQSVIDKSDGNIEVLRNNLRALKASKYPSMPSAENTPMQFWHYYKFLQNTQGQEAADARVKEYFYNNAINKAKGEMVPSF